MNRRIVAVWLSLILVLSCVVIIVETKPPARAATIYVDDDGIPGVTCNYTNIQAAINNSNDGDTIYVWEGTYYENIVVNKTITLIGNGTENTTIDGGGINDVVFVTAHWVNITGFTITNGGPIITDSCIKMAGVHNCSIYQNRVFDNDGFGIYLEYASDIDIDNNNISYNGNRGINVVISSGIDIRGNNIIGYSTSVDFSTSSYCNLIGNNISNSPRGVTLHGSEFINIFDNKFVETGIQIFGSSLEDFNTHSIPGNNTVNGKPVCYYKDQNNLTIDGISVGELILANCSDMVVKNLEINNSAVGVELAYSVNITLSNNYIHSNYMKGIYLVHTNTRYNNISYNDVVDNNYGIRLEYAKNNIITCNNVTDSAYGIDIVWSAHQNNITNNRIWDNSFGINIGGVNGNFIVGNNITECWARGIWIRSSSHNNYVIRNNITNNDLGIRLEGDSNFVYHNNFIGNLVQANDSTNFGNQWDDGYPSGGNYWSDYGGVDNYKGPGQDILGSDGIGDTEYVIDFDSKDDYPLMQPFKPLLNYTLLKPGWNLVSVPLIQDNQDLSKVLEMIDGWYDAVQWYDNTDLNDPWKHHKVSKSIGNDLTHLNETMGFWIHITNPGDTIFLYNGTQPTSNQTITLHLGWNMVGYPSLSDKTRDVALNNLTFGVEVDAVWAHNTTTQKWEDLDSSDYFHLGRGYWIHATQECVWEVPL